MVFIGATLSGDAHWFGDGVDGLVRAGGEEEAESSDAEQADDGHGGSFSSEREIGTAEGALWSAKVSFTSRISGLTLKVGVHHSALGERQRRLRSAR